jgi:hypothetical protein
MPTEDRWNQLPADEKPVLTLDHEWIKATRPFKVEGPWRLLWDAKGAFFGAYIYSADGSIVGVAANQRGPGVGSSDQHGRGEYYLVINALGRWRIKIVNVKESP